MKTWVEISKSNLIHNTKELKKIIPSDKQVMSVVKSNAYGHGLAEVSGILSKKFADLWLGVDSIDEALTLRKNGVKAPILVMGYVLLDRLKDVIDHDIRLVVYNKETIKKLGEYKKDVKVHIKVETGTYRQGIKDKDVLSFVKYIKKYSNIEIEGIYTHFANIEDTTNHFYADYQLERFKKILKILKDNNIKIPIKHTACSAAAILFPETHFNMVRFGTATYGIWSSKETFLTVKKSDIILKPVLTWKTRVAQIKKVKKGMPISYGLTEKLSRDSKIAVIPVGYWDGYDRRFSSIGNVLICGKRCKILGRICMNMCMVDITDLKDVKVEDEVVLLGNQKKEKITVEELAEKIRTINYEVITRINPLIKRIIT
ncbi:MAG: alanine racemase [Patescibacteria group bacterium]|nr:alanine racemase [Patescibacteria group bacterium]